MKIASYIYMGLILGFTTIQAEERYRYNSQLLLNAYQQEGYVCGEAINKIANQYFENNLPLKSVLYALALTESGTSIYNKTTQRKYFVAWPWTINYRAKAYYFPNKQQAVRFASNLIQKGVTNFDVGCMQMNWYYHGGRFESIEDAFDSQVNVEKSLDFLLSIQEVSTWKEAIKTYHSKTNHRRERYYQRFYKNYNFIRKRIDAIQAHFSPTAIETYQQELESVPVQFIDLKGRFYVNRQLPTPTKLSPESEIQSNDEKATRESNEPDLTKMKVYYIQFNGSGTSEVKTQIDEVTNHEVAIENLKQYAETTNQLNYVLETNSLIQERSLQNASEKLKQQLLELEKQLRQ